MKTDSIPIEKIKALRGVFTRNEKEKLGAYFLSAVMCLPFLFLLMNQFVFDVDIQGNYLLVYFVAFCGLLLAWVFIADLKSEVRFGEHEISQTAFNGKIHSIHKRELEEATITAVRRGNYFLLLAGKSKRLHIVLHKDLRVILDEMRNEA